MKSGSLLLGMAAMQLFGCLGEQGPTIEATRSDLTVSKGALSFYMGFQTTSSTADIAGGSGTAADPSATILQGSGLFGQAANANTPGLTWAKKGNLDLARPGSLAFWIKPNQWTANSSQIPLVAIDGSRKLVVVANPGGLIAHFEIWNTPTHTAVAQGSTSGWPTDTSWHLVIVTWGTESIGISFDGATPATAPASWMPGLRGSDSDAGSIFFGGGGQFWIDELMAFNRQLWQHEIQWLWGTRTQATLPNPAVAHFDVTSVATTFHLDYQIASPPTASIAAAGTATAVQSGIPLIQSPGLLGQAIDSRTPDLTWNKANNIDLSKPGSVSFWVKPNGWTDDTLLFIVIDGSRKMLVQASGGGLMAHIEKWNDPILRIQTRQGGTGNWSTDNQWHLLVVNWARDYIALSVDGESPAVASGSWLPGIATGAGSIFAGGAGGPGFLRDELMVLNRPLGDDEILWLYEQRKSPAAPYSALAAFSKGDDSARRIITRYGYFPYSKTMQVEVDLTALPAGTRTVQLQIKNAAGTVVRNTTMPAPSNGVSRMDWNISTDLAAGNYSLVVLVSGVRSSPLQSYPFSRNTFSWEKNNLGTADILPDYFTAIQSNASARSVATIGRSHTVAQSGLWDAASAGTQALLKSPMKYEATVGGSSQSISASLTFPTRTNTRVVTKSDWTAGSLKGTTLGEWDVDGMMKTTITLAPTSSTTSVSKLDLVIPLNVAAIPLMHTVGDHLRGNFAGATPLGTWTGTRTVLWSSATAQVNRSGLRNQFVPYVWLGSPKAGFSVFAENDRGWTPSTATPAISSHELIRTSADTVELRLHLIAAATTITSSAPRTIVIGFQATPVKPMPANWRLWKAHMLLSGLGRGAMHNAMDLYPRGGDFSLYDQLAALRTTPAPYTAFLANWANGYLAYGATAEQVMPPGPNAPNPFCGGLYYCESEFTLRMASQQPNEMESYTNPRGARLDTSEAQTFLNEWLGMRFPQRTWARNTGVQYEVNPVSSFRDYALFHYNKMLTTYADVIYFDDTYLAPTYNTVNSAAYELANKEIQPAASLWDMRALIRRTAILVKGLARPRPNHNMVHMTNAAIAPVIGFAATQLDWEDGSLDALDFQDRYSREYLQAESIGRQFGNVPFALTLIRSEQKDWLTRNAAGVLLTHEIKISDHQPSLPYWENYDRLTGFGYGTTAGTNATTVYNYWDAGYPISITGGVTSSLVVSKPGGAMVVVTDWNAGASTNYLLSIPNKAQLGLTGTIRATNKETNLPLTIDGSGRVAFTLPRHNFMVIEITSS
ncbi:MAG: hypothetical protein H7X95_13700 [Deltaproteobacteria bacterium]|nr:hypothetical protein [Deltaproteobacteria bacterium]